MATVRTIMTELKKKGNESHRATYLRHGAPESMFGVPIADLKVIAKTIKGEQQLAYDLFDTGNVDAMYLAGIVADGSQMTSKQLDAWAKAATCWSMIGEYTVPWMAGENKNGRKLALKWMKSKNESIASTGWNTYSGIVTIKPDEELDLDEIKGLLAKIVDEIDDAPNRVRYTMNNFVICVGAYVKPLLRQAKAAAKKIGKVSVDMGDTSCKVPLATEYIEKIESTKRVGKKRKTIKC